MVTQLSTFLLEYETLTAVVMKHNGVRSVESQLTLRRNKGFEIITGYFYIILIVNN
jgi:hypothetical protein